MNDLSVPGFRRAIEAIHGAPSRFVRRVRVVEAAWRGHVLVFDLLDHPRSPSCYAWEIDGMITLILHDELVDSPRRAVEVAVAEDEPRRRSGEAAPSH